MDYKDIAEDYTNAASPLLTSSTEEPLSASSSLKQEIKDIKILSGGSKGQ